MRIRESTGNNEPISDPHSFLKLDSRPELADGYLSPNFGWFSAFLSGTNEKTFLQVRTDLSDRLHIITISDLCPK